MATEITIYCMEYCPYCQRAKRLLTERGVEFREIMVDEGNDALWDELYARSGMKTLPQIYHGDRCIGGFTELSELDGQDGLESLKKSA